MNHCFVVCDPDEIFSERIGAYVNKNKLAPYLMQTFTDVESLLRFGENHFIDVLLVNELLHCESIEKLNIGKEYLLTEDKYAKTTDGMSKLYKYSSIRKTMEKVVCDFADRNPDAMSTVDRKVNVIVVGAFTPFNDYRSSLFLLTMAAIAAETKKSLYLSIKSTYGYRKILGATEGLDLSDLMYELKSGVKSKSEWPTSIFRSIGLLDYIAPPVSVTDLQCSEIEEWVSLIKELSEKGGYDLIFIDLDESTNACFELLNMCDKIYSVRTTNCISDIVFQEFNEAVEMLGYPELSGKMVAVNPPDWPEYEVNYIEKLRKSEAGAYIEEILKEFI